MATPFAYATAAATAGGCTQDRVEIFEHDETLIVVVADGAGGLGGGAVASDAVMGAVRARIAERPFDAYDIRAWSHLFTTTDAALARRREAGETTAIVVVVGPYGVVGVSAGDSEAWIIGARPDRLTAQQERARIGTGRCHSTPFHRRQLDGVLVVASDGLFKNVRSEALTMACATADATTIAKALIELPRLRSGAYPDDVTVAVVTNSSTRV
jgi:serine/threonine protein phosphatase PrpC